MTTNLANNAEHTVRANSTRPGNPVNFPELAVIAVRFALKPSILPAANSAISVARANGQADGGIE